MSIGADLLRLLGPGSAAIPGQPTAAAQPTGIDFASLLQKAGAGAISSGLPVTIAGGANVKLSPQQLSQIATAADQAQAQGATRALVLIDGKALSLDVSVRQITGQADLRAAGVFSGVDAVINIPSPGSESPGRAVPLPRAGYASPSLLRTLGRTQDS
jgi:hypothetical protein